MAEPRTKFDPKSKVAYISELGRLRETRDWDTGSHHDLRYLAWQGQILPFVELKDKTRTELKELLTSAYGTGKDANFSDKDRQVLDKELEKGVAASRRRRKAESNKVAAGKAEQVPTKHGELTRSRGTTKSSPVSETLEGLPLDGVNSKDA
jgi:hypothetical protein